MTFRESLGLTVKDFANRVGIAPSAISHYEHFDHLPSCENLIQISKAFHVSTDYLLGISSDTASTGDIMTLDLSNISKDDIELLSAIAGFLKGRHSDDGIAEEPMTCNDRLKKLRKERALSQSQVAELLGIKQRNYSNYESGDVRIPIDSLITLARYYNVSTDYISGVSSIRKPFPEK